MTTPNIVSVLQTIEEQLIDIPAGEITLNDDRISKKWTVNIKPFKMSRFLVTQNEYEAIVGSNPSTFNNSDNPVETVTWVDAIQFCNALSEQFGLTPCYQFDESKSDFVLDEKANGYRLPTEAEWEYTCKADTKEVRYGILDEIAWFKDNSGGSPHAVGTKLPNNWGVYDMLGNVWEWCSDIYDETVYGSYRIFRGGGWSDQERGCLASNRRRSHPTSFKIDDLGFRIARNKF